MSSTEILKAMNEIYKQFSPTPKGLLDMVNHAMSLDDFNQLKESLWLIKHRYFISCETCNQTGKVTYFSSPNPLEQELELISETAQLEDCPDCEGNTFNFVWDVPDYTWKVEDD